MVATCKLLIAIHSVMNAINRRNGASPGFVFVWLVGDVVNTVGLARAGATETQIGKTTLSAVLKRC